MVNKCSVFGCKTNYDGHDAGTVFGLKAVKDPERKAKWFAFCNRKDLRPDGSIFVCEKHFEEKFMRRNDKQPRLNKNLNPVPTIQPLGVYEDKPSCLPSIPKARKPPKQRVFQPDQQPQYESTFVVESFEDINESLLELLDSAFKCSTYEDHVVYYKTVMDDLSIPQITQCIRIDSELHVRLFFKGSPVPLPDWFRKNSSSKFTNKSQLPEFCSHIKRESEKWGDVLDELQQLRYKKSPVYSANLIRYALMLRYSSLQAYKLMM